MAEPKEEAQTPEPLTIRGGSAYASLYSNSDNPDPYLAEAITPTEVASYNLVAIKEAQAV